MVTLIDTNVVIDFLSNREPFFNDAVSIMQKCSSGEISGYIAEYTIPTVFYILRRQFSVSERRIMLSQLCQYMGIAELDKAQVLNAIKNEHFDDLEDCLQAECAAAIDAYYIVTRNVADFANSIIPAILPENFLAKLDAQ
ncbi:MAG: PIN domain-containing protein [Spirochaetaceae bacterium]|nr:PIN domain-containing protein [Spirochaetaceae bacterium]